MHLIYCADNLEQVHKAREARTLDYFDGFEFTGVTIFEIDRFRRKEGREIKPLTVREILEEEITSADRND